MRRLPTFSRSVQLGELDIRLSLTPPSRSFINQTFLYFRVWPRRHTLEDISGSRYGARE
jgi:hypothetical protein